MSAAGMLRTGMTGAVGEVWVVEVVVVIEEVVEEDPVVVPMVPVVGEVVPVVVEEVEDEVVNVGVDVKVGVVALAQLENINRAAVIRLIPGTSLDNFTLCFIWITPLSR
jgi:hypothetical protein